MKQALAALAVTLVLAAPLRAQMLPGADDPAFRAALDALLAANDAAAVATLRDLAEAGNTAALVTLPLALEWVPPQGNLKQKNAQRQVGGVKAQEAAAKAHRATALWNAGLIEDPKDLPDRIAGLLALGEPERAAVLLAAWVHQSGGQGELPAALLTGDMPVMLGAFALSGRLTDAVYRGGPAMDEAARLLALMRDDRLVGWVTYVYLLKTQPDIFNVIGSPLAGTGLSAAETEDRIDDARAARAVWFGFANDDTPTPADTAARARAVLQGRAEFLPVTRLCQAHCPDSAASCETAVLVYPGLPFGDFARWQPFADVLDPLEFAASDRGLAVLIRDRWDRAAATDRATAESLDACYAAVLSRRDRISF